MSQGRIVEDILSYLSNAKVPHVVLHETQALESCVHLNVISGSGCKDAPHSCIEDITNFIAYFQHFGEVDCWLFLISE